MPRQSRELLTDVGIEIEFVEATQGNLANDIRLRELDASVVHDASAETPGYVLRNGIKLNNNTKISVKSGRNVKCGGEIVTSVWYNSEDGVVYEKLKAITEFLRDYGEPQKTERCGIHFHINYAQNLNTLHNLMLLGGHMEKVFFTLGGMGYENRGVKNDAIYFRPITGKGPLVVPYGNGSWAQVFTIPDLLEAGDSDVFFLRLGDMFNIGQGTRYFPARYHWLNLCNLVLAKSTLEFRLFNTSLDALNIWSALQFSTAFARVCLYSKTDDLRKAGLCEENSVFTAQGKDKILATAENFCEFAQIGTKVRDLVMSILDITPEPTFEEYYTKSHLHTLHEVPVHWRGSPYKPKKIPDSQVKNPTYVDYHTLSSNSRGEMSVRARRTPRPARESDSASENMWRVSTSARNAGEVIETLSDSMQSFSEYISSDTINTEEREDE